jgi:hypothetical protein
MPCFSAFCADLALPSAVVDPRDLAPFLRPASARALDTGRAARGAAPALDMARFLAGRGLAVEGARTGALEKRAV